MATTTDPVTTDTAAEAETDTDSDEAVEPRPDDSSPVSGWLAVAAAAAAVVPFVVAAVRGIADSWAPTGDDTYPALRALDVFNGHLPLIGWWSSASDYAGRELNHPGPLQFDFLAPTVWLFGPRAGTVIGTALINAGAIVLVAWLVNRRLGPAAAALAMGVATLLTWSMGSEMLYDPWTMFATLWPFALFLLAAWCLAAGDVVAAPVMVVAGGFILQTHLTYSLLVPLVGLVAIGWATAMSILACRRDAAPGDPRIISRRTAAKWSGISLAIGLVTWAQPLYEQFVDHEGPEGNLDALMRSTNVDVMHPTLKQALGAFGGTVAVPPMWLPGSYGSPSFNNWDPGPPLWLAGGALVLLVAALGLLGWRANRRGSWAVAAGTVIALVTLAVGFLTMVRMPTPHGGVPSTYARYLWPLGMAVWLVVAVAVLDEVRARGWLSGRRLALPGLCLVVVAAGLALPRRVYEAEPAWSREALDAVDDEMLAAIEDAGGGPVLLDMPYHNTTALVGYPLMYVLADTGIDFYVRDGTLERQVGRSREYVPGSGDARLVLMVRSGEYALPEVDGVERFAYWSALSQDDLDELADLTDQVRAIVAEHGVVLNADGERYIDALEAEGSDVRAQLEGAQADPDSVIVDRTLSRLWTGPMDGINLLDESIYPAEVMDRWSMLTTLDLDRQVALYLQPITPRD